MTQINVGYHKKFLKEKRKLSRKCRSIEGDFEDFKKALMVDIKYNNYTVPTDTEKYFRISGLDKSITLPAFVAKVFYCEKMNRGSHSGFRITFIYDPSENYIYFVQFYFKSKDEIEDKERINKLFKPDMMK